MTALFDQNGSKCFSASYDPWGRRYVTTGSIEFDRGYTGHEHIDELALIDMNGRMYDPILGRFISVDPYIQDPYNPQNFNRYAYCLNNPLRYTDPSGEIIGIDDVIIGIAFGALVGGTTGTIIGRQNDASGLKLFGYIAGGAVIGGLASWAAVGIGTAGGGACLSGAVYSSINGAGFSGLANKFDKNAVWHGAWTGYLSGFIGGGVGGAIGGRLGAFCGGASSSGINTKLNGGNQNQTLISSLIGGTFSLAQSEAMSYLKWKYDGGNKLGNYDITYKQYRIMQSDYQRSRFWRKEFGGILTTDGKVVRAPYKFRHDFYIDFDPEWTGEATGKVLAMYHTHWAKAGRIYFPEGYTGDNGIPASDGPSPRDYEMSSKYNLPSLLFDRKYSYLYLNSNNQVPPVGNLFVKYYPGIFYPLIK
ncbi:MAG: RHS repeat-associated core domain-containing protein [Bacteroidaceae bacterium]|nr:RHS repeat-associated core domain-containing protein [Bacteroidaceae bacterium]